MVTETTTRIVRNPEIWGGDPIIKGTRIPVALVAFHFKTLGESYDSFHLGYPHLDREAIDEALSYYEDHRTEIDALIVEHEFGR